VLSVTPALVSPIVATLPTMLPAAPVLALTGRFQDPASDPSVG
jgi:hypothetical protein